MARKGAKSNKVGGPRISLKTHNQRVPHATPKPPLDGDLKRGGITLKKKKKK